jgi:hypothetical protein
MTTLTSCVEEKSGVSVCRYCRHYTPEGQRGGMCQMLSVAVKSEWKACSLAVPSFQTVKCLSSEQSQTAKSDNHSRTLVTNHTDR